MGRFFGVDTANTDAVATAEASPANAMTCVKPFTIPDRWIEKQDPGGFDSLNSTFDSADQHGNPLGNPDIYIPADQPGYTGYNAERDKGMPLMIRAGTGNNINPSMYFSYAIGGDTGGAAYRWNIANCNTTYMGWGDLLLMEPGNMVGPTDQGIDDLIALDPDAYWDTTLNNVRQHEEPQPACCRDSALRPGLLRHREIERSHCRLEGRQLPGLLHRATPGKQRLRPHHPDLGPRQGRRLRACADGRLPQGHPSSGVAHHGSARGPRGHT